MNKRGEPMTNDPIDIFSLLNDSSEKQKKKRREELLAPTGIKEFFSEGKITINKNTCHGVECKKCVAACPTNALFWSGEVGVIEDLCVYCGACVLSCMIDDCIIVERKRDNGQVERFSKPKEVIRLMEKINNQKRIQRVKDVFSEKRTLMKNDFWLL